MAWFGYKTKPEVLVALPVDVRTKRHKTISELYYLFNPMEKQDKAMECCFLKPYAQTQG
jgi:hypothetical protein